MAKRKLATVQTIEEGSRAVYTRCYEQTPSVVSMTMRIFPLAMMIVKWFLLKNTNACEKQLLRER